MPIITKKETFKNKSIIIFDDVVTMGDTVKKYIEDIENEGGHVLAIVSLARTVNLKKMEIAYKAKNEIQEIYDNFSDSAVIDIEEGEAAVYLSDGCWLYPNGSICE